MFNPKRKEQVHTYYELCDKHKTLLFIGLLIQNKFRGLCQKLSFLHSVLPPSNLSGKCIANVRISDRSTLILSHNFHNQIQNIEYLIDNFISNIYSLALFNCVQRP